MSDEEAGGSVELQQAPVVRKNHGGANLDDRLKNARGRSRRRNDNDQNNDSDDDGEGEDELAPLTSSNSREKKKKNTNNDEAKADSDDEEKNANVTKKTTTKMKDVQSKLWSEDDAAVNEALRKRYADLRPYIQPVKTKTFTFQQNMVRFLNMLIFSHVICGFQVLCVMQHQCFDTADDPSVMWIWDVGFVPAMLVIMFGVVPLNLWLLNDDNLTRLKWGAFLQIALTITFSGFGGLCYGNGWGAGGSVSNEDRKIVRDNVYFDETGHPVPYSYPNNMRFPDEAMHYYGITHCNGCPAGIDSPDWGVEVAMLEEEQIYKAGSIMLFSFGAAVLFLANFSFHIMHLCHVNYNDPHRNGNADL
ncbi:hypothetical protein ScalyP_jg5385 [Parmales sp. scaly parma]|nr:hypothetical protein ScalyP_jg5385 [Parmales sp. scaly parma]